MSGYLFTFLNLFNADFASFYIACNALFHHLSFAGVVTEDRDPFKLAAPGLLINMIDVGWFRMFWKIYGFGNSIVGIFLKSLLMS